MRRARAGARKGPTVAEKREAHREAMAAINAKLWTLTPEQEQGLREAFEAGPGGVYAGHGSWVQRVGARLVEGGCAEYRTVHRVSTTPRSVHDQRPCEWDDYYIVPTRYGLSLIGISLLPRPT